MSSSRYALTRVRTRALDATISRAGGVLSSWARRGVSLIAGQESFLWSIDTDGTQTRPLDQDAEAAMSNLVNPVIFSCLKVRSDALISPAFVVERRNPEDGTYVPEPHHPLSMLIKRPSDTIDTATLWRCLEASYSSLGKVYLEPIRTARRGELDGLNPLNPAWMHEEIDAAGNLEAYRYEVPDLPPVMFGPTELITRRAVIWAAPPPLYVALGPAEADAAASQFVSGFLAGGGVPSSIIKTREDWDQGRVDTFREIWMRTFTPGNKLPAILGRSIESYERIGVGLNELDTEATRMLIETRMCQAYGVPPLIIYSMAGLIKATYSNLKESWDNWWTAGGVPLLREWADWINWSLLALYEDRDAIRSGDVRVRFDVTGIGPYQEDTAAKVQQYLDGHKARAVTLNEYRATLGLKPLQGGDELPTAPEPPPELPAPDAAGDENKTMPLLIEVRDE